MKIKILFLGLALSGAPLLAQELSIKPCALPPRTNSDRWSSAQFYKNNQEPSADRELNVIREVLRGNIPSRARKFLPLRLPAKINGADFILELRVSQDYLMIGNDNDSVRVPLTNYAAQHLASELGMSLPTAFLVDKIYEQANVQLIPQPTDWYKHGIDMRLGSNYIVFNQMIESQRAGRPGLVAGHKKDVVLTNRLDQAPARVAIYGWQRPGNKPLQPLATPHNYDYEDYSHGVRLLGPKLKVIAAKTGQTVVWPLPQALADKVLGNILNGGNGPINDPRAARTCSTEFRKELGFGKTCPNQPYLCK